MRFYIQPRHLLDDVALMKDGLACRVLCMWNLLIDSGVRIGSRIDGVVYVDENRELVQYWLALLVLSIVLTCIALKRW